MATLIDPDSGISPETVLAARLADSLLPSDAADFDALRLAEAARFIGRAAARRRGSEPSLAIESVTGTDARSRLLRIAVINDDMPFLVDSVCATLTRHGLSIDRLAHPVMPVRRDPEGRLVALPEGEAIGELRESMIYCETDRVDARARRALVEDLHQTLADVHAAVADWPRMQAAMMDDARLVPDAEAAALMRWLAEGMLTLLGRVVRHRDGRLDDRLGICRASQAPLLSDGSYARAFAYFEAADAAGAPPRVPLVVKANRIARVHRSVPLDLFIVPVREQGQVVALSVHAGVWTSNALMAAPDRVPLMRSQFEALTHKLGISRHGHAGKSLAHALTTLPHDLLISFADHDLERIATTMMSLLDRPRPRLELVEAPLARHLFAFVWLPRDVQSTDLRQRIQAMLEEAAGAQVIDWSLQVDSNALAIVRFVLDIREGAGAPDGPALDRALQVMVRGWDLAVEAELAQTEEPSRAAAIAARYAGAFPPGYRHACGPAEAAADIRALRPLGVAGAPRRTARLHGAGDALRLKLYQRDGAIVLSDAVPVLENFGFRVMQEVPTALSGGKLGHIHDFLVEAPGGAAPLIARKGAIEDALSAVLNGEAEDDAFNRLIPALGLTPEQTGWLRAWYRYLRQTGLAVDPAAAVGVLQRAGGVTHGLIALFAARHDPAFAGNRDGAIAAAEEAIRSGLAQVAAISDDRLLRAYHTVTGAILRTNAFAPAAAEALAFKFDPAQIGWLPRPVPWREIFVYSPRVEGVHLRAGPIARGGLRWSDRRDDFRTEILGLMKAQRVKNAVIVPTGAKGGFYPKRLPDPARDRDGWLAEGRASYQVFIRTLLSITDTIAKGAVVHPAGVMIHDGEDPYFVVAADKGTATFSDTANALAEAAGFWLDDAFASGGSKGYDHKAMGITARGAWISVERHFREMGIDVATDPVRVIGVGDMSGDVFGNGMLLSRAIKLVAAFDHRHIFLDPDPDPARSHAERARLFALPRSSWDDYDRAVISAGGGVYPRSLKSIPLSEPVRAMLGIEAETIDPESLIRTILKARVDLLWFGGIGTYVRASAETNGVVGDPANDPIRVAATELRAKVIGEGANLGTTQAGRIEFALNGGRINTDFIDNSAGVDCSDNEVNIKIALASARRAGRIDEPGRVALLAEMTDAVADLVLADNRMQALALSVAERGGAAAVPALARLVDVLEDHGELDRATEGLASAEDYARRAASGQGFARPELAVILSTAKLALQRAIETSALVDDPLLEGELMAAFPPAMHDRFAEDIRGHRLRREVIATKLANRVINRLGPVHPFELVEEEGATLPQVVAAFVVAERLLDCRTTWHMLETATVDEDTRLALFDRTARVLRGHIADTLRAGRGTLAVGALVDGLGDGVGQLSNAVGDLLRGAVRAEGRRLAEELAAMAVPGDLAARVVGLYDLDGAIGLAGLAAAQGVDPVQLTTAFADLGTALRLDWAQQAASRAIPSDPWERLLVAGLARDFQQMRLEFLARAGAEGPIAFATRWLADQAEPVAVFRSLVGRAETSGSIAPAMLAQLASQARSLLMR